MTNYMDASLNKRILVSRLTILGTDVRISQQGKDLCRVGQSLNTDV